MTSPTAGMAGDATLDQIFSSALVKLDQQIEMAVSDIRIRPWAGDPNSQTQDHSNNDPDSALDSLQAYQRQLKGAADALQTVEHVYQNLNPGGSFRITPVALPRLHKVFSSALVKLDQQIEMAVSDIRIRPWAGDPVSKQAAQEFNNHSTDGPDSALNSLQAYQRQLKGAADALQTVEHVYHDVEHDNAELLTVNPGGKGGC